jgi:hypothetical protein
MGGFPALVTREEEISMKKVVLVLIVVGATIGWGSLVATAQVKTEQGGKGVSQPSDKAEMGRTDPKGDAALSSKEPKGGVQVKGQPEPAPPTTSK